MGEAGPHSPTQQGPPLQDPDQQGLPTDQPQSALWGCPPPLPKGKGRFGVGFRALLLLSPAAPSWGAAARSWRLGHPLAVTSPNGGVADPCWDPKPPNSRTQACRGQSRHRRPQGAEVASGGRSGVPFLLPPLLPPDSTAASRAPPAGTPASRLRSHIPRGTPGRASAGRCHAMGRQRRSDSRLARSQGLACEQGRPRAPPPGLRRDWKKPKAIPRLSWRPRQGGGGGGAAFQKPL